jgi:(2Fe-2S) ferredoxin
MARLTKSDLDKMHRAAKPKDVNWVKVGMSSCGIAAGADTVYKTFEAEVKKRGLDLEVRKCGCQGMCHAEPLVEVHTKGLPDVVYGRVDDETAMKIIDEHVGGRNLVKDHIYELRVKGY